MEKNKLLKGAGIALIVIGAFAALLALLCFVAGDLIAGIIGAEANGTGAVKIVMIIMGVLFIIVAAAYIGAGVAGVKQKSAKSCFVIAIILIVISGLSAIYDLTSGQWYSAIIVLVVPIIYLVGAIQFKKAAAAPVVEQAPVEQAPVEQVQSDDVQD